MKTSPDSIIFWKKMAINLSILLLVALFLYAAYNKLSIYSIFVTQLKLTPPTEGYENFLAWFVPAMEIIITLLLLVKRTRLIGLYGAFYLMLAFSAWTYIIPHFYSEQSCSCSGIINQFSWKQHFWFNVAFMMLAATGLILSSSLRQLERKTQ